MNSKPILAGVIVSVVAAGIFFWHQSSHVNSSDLTIQRDKTQLSVANEINAPTAKISPVGKKPQLTLVEKFNSSNDLFDLVNELRNASENGNAEATWLISKAYEECFLLSVSGAAGFENDMQMRMKITPDINKAGTSNAFKKVAQRCGRFSGQAIKLAEITALKSKAAGQGSLAAAAEAFQVGMITNPALNTPARQKSLAHDALASRNPEAMAALATAMGQVAADRMAALSPLPAGTPQAEAAWNIAACRMGKACDRSSPTMIQMCVAGGVGCGNQSVEEFYLKEIIPAGEQAKLQGMVKQLTSGSKS